MMPTRQQQIKKKSILSTCGHWKVVGESDEEFYAERLEVGGKHSDGTGILGTDLWANQGGLGVLHLQTMNLVFLTKWVGRLMSTETDITLKLEEDSYGPWMD